MCEENIHTSLGNMVSLAKNKEQDKNKFGEVAKTWNTDKPDGNNCDIHWSVGWWLSEQYITS